MTKFVSDSDTIDDNALTIEWECEDGYRYWETYWETFNTEAEAIDANKVNDKYVKMHTDEVNDYNLREQIKSIEMAIEMAESGYGYDNKYSEFFAEEYTLAIMSKEEITLDRLEQMKVNATKRAELLLQ